MTNSKSSAWAILTSLAPIYLLSFAVLLLFALRLGGHRPIIHLLLMRYGHAGTAMVENKWQGRYGNRIMLNFQCRPNYAPTVDVTPSSEIYERLHENDHVKIHFETIWCSFAAIDDDAMNTLSLLSPIKSSSLIDSKDTPPIVMVMRWIRGLLILVMGFYFLRFLWSMLKVTYQEIKLNSESDEKDDPDDKIGALIAKMDQRLRPASSRKTIKLWVAGLLLGIVGAIGFSTTSGGFNANTVGYLAFLVTGVILVGFGIFSDQKDRSQTKFASVIQPDSPWKVSQNFGGDDELQGQYNGFPVQVLFQNAIRDRAGTEISPVQTIVRFALPNASTMKLALRRDTPWWGTDIKDLWAHLPPIESLSIDQLKLFGSPPDQAEALVSQWLRQDFSKWSKTVKERLDLTLNLARLEGKLLEFHFEGWMTEPLLEEEPSLRQQLDELLRGCLPWCTSLN